MTPRSIGKGNGQKVPGMAECLAQDEHDQLAIKLAQADTPTEAECLTEEDAVPEPAKRRLVSPPVDKPAVEAAKKRYDPLKVAQFIANAVTDAKVMCWVENGRFHTERIVELTDGSGRRFRKSLSLEFAEVFQHEVELIR